MSARIASVTAGALLLLTALTACTAPAGLAPTTAPPSASVPGSSEPAASPSPTEASGELTCDTMISAGTVDALTAAGWTAQPTTFRIGDVELTGGLLCFWADYTVGSDHGQLYGWSQISPDDAATARSALTAAGWRPEDGPAGMYVTEDPQYAMGTDDDGYGMTYLFGDGWVKFADTKQSLLLIEWDA